MMMSPHNKKSPKLTDDRIRQIDALFAEGVHQAEIARRMDLSATTISRVVNRQLLHAKRVGTFDALARVADAARAYCELVEEEQPTYDEAHASSGTAYWTRKAAMRPRIEAEYVAMAQALRAAGYSPVRPEYGPGLPNKPADQEAAR